MSGYRSELELLTSESIHTTFWKILRDGKIDVLERALQLLVRV
jgi:hypothetical protein